MGNAIFKDELKSLNNIVSGIINNDNLYKNAKYSTQMDDICDNYTVVLESSLNKHIKIELESLKDAIYMIPITKHVEKPSIDKTIKKQNLCQLISDHYRKILEIILVIKYVYDLENNGDENLASLTLKCVQSENNIMKVIYCNSVQSSINSDKLDFSKLKGFEVFNNKMLNERERSTLAYRFQNTLLGKEEDACDDAIFTPKDLKNMGIKKLCTKEQKIHKIQKINELVHNLDKNLKFSVGLNNPVLNDFICAQQENVFIDLRTPKSKPVLVKYEMMKKSYSDNLKKIVQCLLEIVEPEGNEYKLRSINNEQLNIIKKKIKQTITQFYCETIYNFHEFIKVVKKSDVFSPNKADPFTFI